MSFEIKYKVNGYYVKFFGKISTKEIIECDNKIIGDKRFRNSTFIIADFSNVSGIMLYSLDIKLLTEMDRASQVWNKKINLALVSENHDHHILLNEYIKGSKDSNWTIKKFDCLTEAESFIQQAVI